MANSKLGLRSRLGLIRDFTEGIQGGGRLLDINTNAVAAYSLRLLRTDYGGSVIRVRRSSDNTEINIGFIDNELDISTLTSFCTGTDGFVTTWYDQSGGTNNITQTTANLQPQIVDDGNLLFNNSKPTIKFNRNALLSDFFLTPDILIGFHIFSVYQHISQISTSFNTNFNYSIGNSVSPETDRGMQFATTGAVDNPISYTLSVQGSGAIIDTLFTIGQKLISSLIKSEATNLFINNSLIEENTNILPSYTSTPFRICLGRAEWLAANVPSNMNLQEFILYNSNQSSNRTSIESNINNYYNIY